MNIVFKSKDGFCPSFIYKDTDYYLYEDYVGGEYQWCLMCKPIKPFSITFKSELEVRNWLFKDDMQKEEFDRLNFVILTLTRCREQELVMIRLTSLN